MFSAEVITDSQHLVDNWGDGAAHWWYYVPWIEKYVTRLCGRGGDSSSSSSSQTYKVLC